MQFEIFLISASYISNRKFAALAQALMSANTTPCNVVRLEQAGENMFDALDAAKKQGARHITLRPIGMPFSQSLRKWVPSAAGDWLARQIENEVHLTIANDLDEDMELLTLVANRPYQSTPIAPKIDGLSGKGWDAPPDFEHHLLVCTGPRCHMRGSFGVLAPLKDAIARAGLSSKCLIASTGCLFPCNSGPVVVHYPKGDWYQLNSEAEIAQFVQTVLIEKNSSPLRLPFSPHTSERAATDPQVAT